MARCSAGAADASVHMRALGDLDAWNDARDGERHWYGLIEAAYQRGEVHEADWRAYREAYETEWARLAG
ncbi:MAG TPA: hypothetical protein VHB98_23600 [Chloroflexota bacterium]|nr:hypothetical protein [Chloroflexota bacterium]